MAPSAAPSIQQSYSAGNCRLDLALQPSALSQWHPKLIAKQVEFKLWMNEAQNAEPTLLAEGDRTTLQAIAQHIEHRTQSLLAVGRTHSRPDSRATSPAPPLPEGTQLPNPLSYLQLCDLSTVLTQSEQAAQTLPAAISIPSEATRLVASPVASRLAIAPSSTTESSRRGRLIPFPTGRRAAWASSAAAALFAIGLTTTLWDRTSVPQTASVAEPNITAPENERLKLNKNDQRTATLPNNRSGASEPEGSRIQTAQRQNTTDQRTTKPGNLEQGSQPPSRSSTNNPPTSGSAPPTPTESPSVSPAAAPTPNPSASATADDQIAAAPVPANRPTPDSALDRKIDSAEPETEALGPAPFSAQTAEADNAQPARPQASIRRSNDGVSRESPSPSQTAAAEPVPSTTAISQQESETIAQVRNHFANQWRPNENLSAPLSYQLQLSSTGEVVSFLAITEGGGAYRDHLLPNNDRSFPPSNSAALADGITLKITLTPSGQVQVEKM